MRLFATLLITFCFFSSVVLAAELEIVYPRPESSNDARTDYPVQLLTLAFQKSGAEVSLVPSNGIMVQSRSLSQLARGREVDVVWSMTSDERENKLEPIRIPIYKGLIGWRLFLHVPDNGVLLDQDINLDQLQDYTLIQGHDWPDTQVLRQAGFQVYGVANYHSIFEVLARGRVDLFPRSLSEIWAEFEAFKHLGIEVEPHVLLQYPTAFYFFVSKENLELKALIERGLNIALDDGSFDQLFWQHHRSVIEQARLGQRKIFRLNNPILPEATPLNDSRLWYRQEATR